MANNFSGDSSCKALWRFESGALTTDSIGSNTLTDYNTVGTNTTQFMEGAASADFEKDASERLGISDSSLDSGFPGKSGESNGSFTCCFWVMFESITLNRGVFAKFINSSGNRGYQALIGASNNIVFQKGVVSDSSAFESYPHGSALGIGKWYHVGIAYDDSTQALRIRIWDDNAGAILGSDVDTTTTTGIYVGSAMFALGQSSAGYHDGELDEFVVFSRALSASEIDAVRSGEFGEGGSTLYSAIFDSLCRSSLLASRLADSRADAGLVATVTHDTAASVAEEQTSLHDSRLSAATLATLPIDASAAVSALTARLTDTAVAVTELVNEIRWFDTRVDAAGLAARLVDTRAVAARDEARRIDSAAKVAALEARLIDTGTAVAGLLDEIRRFDTRVAASVLEVAEVDLRAAVSLAEARAVDALAAVAECVTALHDTHLSAAELEARVWDTLANTGEILQALGPIFSPGLHSITVQRAILSVTPIRGLRRFDGH